MSIRRCGYFRWCPTLIRSVSMAGMQMRRAYRLRHQSHDKNLSECIDQFFTVNKYVLRGQRRVHAEHLFTSSCPRSLPVPAVPRTSEGKSRCSPRIALVPPTRKMTALSPLANSTNQPERLYMVVLIVVGKTPIGYVVD